MPAPEPARTAEQTGQTTAASGEQCRGDSGDAASSSDCPAGSDEHEPLPTRAFGASRADIKCQGR